MYYHSLYLRFHTSLRTSNCSYSSGSLELKRSRNCWWRYCLCCPCWSSAYLPKLGSLEASMWNSGLNSLSHFHSPLGISYYSSYAISYGVGTHQDLWSILSTRCIGMRCFCCRGLRWTIHLLMMMMTFGDHLVFLWVGCRLVVIRILENSIYRNTLQLVIKSDTIVLPYHPYNMWNKFHKVSKHITDFADIKSDMASGF